MSGLAPPMEADVLGKADWECAATLPGVVRDPSELAELSLSWCPAPVPGTVAGALRDAGAWHWGQDDEALLDGHDWWFRCRFETSGGDGPWDLRFGGLATIADAWLNGRHLLHSENMFLRHLVAVSHLPADNDLVLRFAALTPRLAQRRPRPRWRSHLVRSQNLRWYRTTLLGRVPGWARWAAPVGPWRQVSLEAAASPVTVLDHQLEVSCEGASGVVRLRATLRPLGLAPTAAVLRVGSAEAVVTLVDEGPGGLLAEGSVHLASVERWLPHTHGPQPLYPVSLVVAGAQVALGSVGFRTIEVDREGGAFTLSVNGVPTFCRGACWVGPDAVSLAPSPAKVRASLELAKDAGMNMVRVTGYAVYEDTAFWDACDELGLLVWQDCMMAGFDPPEAPEFVDTIVEELTDVFGHLGGRPSLAIVCGSSETQQQAAMYGLPAERRASPLLEETIPALLARILPGVPYVASTPTGGDLPFHPGTGLAHYFGVGAYLRPPTDVRLAGVRFAAECLAFSIPPETETVEETFGDSAPAGHDSDWKRGVTRDSGTSWDFEDVRDHYVRELFGVDPLEVRYSDPDRALDLGRAAVAELMATTMMEWRSPRSPCAGALVLSWSDLWPGAGWGLLDCLGRPKAPWYALRRVFAPVAVLVTDEGLAGLAMHVVNDRPEPFIGRLELRLYASNGATVEAADHTVDLGPRASSTVGVESVLGGFRDINRAYRFGPPAYDVLVASLRGCDGSEVSEVVHLALGLKRPMQADLGLQALARQRQGGSWALTVSSRHFAQFVAIDIPGFRPSDSWFHLAPGASRTVELHAEGRPGEPAGRVRALNSAIISLVVLERPRGSSG